jgi:hypothetical protein
MSEWIPVDSSNLNRVRYEEDRRRLEIEFNDGSVYEFYEVPPAEFDGLLAADSHGSYFYKHIRENYSYNRV